MSVHLVTVAVNTPPGSTRLRFAEAAAKRFARLVTSSAGPVTPQNAAVFIGVHGDARAVRAHLRSLSVGRADHVIFYFCGHGNELGIALANGLYPYDDLASDLRSIGARTITLVLDTCHAGASARFFGERIASNEWPPPYERAWLAALQAACPGVRILAATSAGGVTHEDARIKSSRFTHALIQALRFSPGDLTVGGVSMVSDVGAAEEANRILVSQWPNIERPQTWGPWACGGYGAFPLMVSEADQRVGHASVRLFEPGIGRTARLMLDVKHRRQLVTRVSWSVSDHAGRTLVWVDDQWVPTNALESCRRLLSFRAEVLLEDPWHGPWLQRGRGVQLTWSVLIRDAHGRLLAHKSFVEDYWLERQVG